MLTSTINYNNKREADASPRNRPAYLRTLTARGSVSPANASCAGRDVHKYDYAAGMLPRSSLVSATLAYNKQKRMAKAATQQTVHN